MRQKDVEHIFKAPKSLQWKTDDQRHISMFNIFLGYLKSAGLLQKISVQAHVVFHLAVK